MGTEIRRSGGGASIATAADGRDEATAIPKQQFAALPWRPAAGGGIEVLLISSRDTGRWIVPKGWPIDGRTGAETAAVEAFEEAGVEGVVDRDPIGTFDYLKAEKRGDCWCRVTVYPLEVTRELSDWPERAMRSLLWLPPEQAAERADDAGLAELIRMLPHRAGRAR